MPYAAEHSPWVYLSIATVGYEALYDDLATTVEGTAPLEIYAVARWVE